MSKCCLRLLTYLMLNMFDELRWDRNTKLCQKPGSFSWSSPLARVFFVNAFSKENLREMDVWALFQSAIEVMKK